MPYSSNMNDRGWSVREANLADLDGLVKIAIAAMPMDPQWDYRFPLRRSYAQDTYDFTYLKYQEFMDSPQTWRIMVAEHSDPEQCARGAITDEPQHTIAAFAVWDIANLPGPSVVTAPTPTPAQSPIMGERRDGHQARMTAWAKAMPRAKEQLFNSRYGNRHIQLQILATHPAWQRRGAGQLLCLEGMELARTRNMAVTVFASPMGRRLYSKLGFQIRGYVHVQVPGEEQSVSPVALSFEPDNGRLDITHEHAKLETMSQIMVAA